MPSENDLNITFVVITALVRNIAGEVIPLMNYGSPDIVTIYSFTDYMNILYVHNLAAYGLDLSVWMQGAMQETWWS